MKTLYQCFDYIDVWIIYMTFVWLWLNYHVKNIMNAINAKVKQYILEKTMNLNAKLEKPVFLNINMFLWLTHIFTCCYLYHELTKSGNLRIFLSIMCVCMSSLHTIQFRVPYKIGRKWESLIIKQMCWGGLTSCFCRFF